MNFISRESARDRFGHRGIQDRFVSNLCSEFDIGRRQKLIVGLVDDEPAFPEHVKRDEWDASRDQDRYGV